MTKLSDRLSVSDESDYITEPSIAVAVVQPAETDTTAFSIVGDGADYTKTRRSAAFNGLSTDPVLFSVKILHIWICTKIDNRSKKLYEMVICRKVSCDLCPKSPMFVR